MPTIRERYLPLLDLYRGKLNTTWDLRRYDVLVRVNTWSGGVVGTGNKTTVDTPLLVNGGARPKVEQLAQKDILASGGLYQDQDLRVGPLTPYAAGYPAGVDPSTFDPPAGGAGVEVLFRVTGPGMAGAWYQKVGQDISGNFGLFLIVRKTAVQSP